MRVKLFKSVNGIVQINEPHIKIAVIIDQYNNEDSQDYYKGGLRTVQVSFLPHDFTHYEEIIANSYVAYSLLQIINHIDNKELIAPRTYRPYFEARTELEYSNDENQSIYNEPYNVTLVGILCITP